ncbi:MAG: hypothetical protein RLZZ414_2059 [Bacteroidota bacterium]
MLEQSKKIWFFVISGIFILINAVFILSENFVFTLTPLVIAFAYLALFRLDILYKIIIFFVPISVTLNELEIETKVDMSLPTEPLLFGILIIFMLRLLYDGGFDKKILKHPVSILVLMNILWIFVTMLMSTSPLISLKYLLVQLWFLATFYFVSSQIFKQKNNLNQFFWLYTAGFSLVIAYTIIMHIPHNFSQKSANWVMSPFFDDHTSYGACIAFFLPFLTGKLLSKEILGTKKLLMFLFYTLFLFALITCYTRAAWLSLIAALVLFIVLKLKIKWWIISGVALVGLIVVILSWNQIILALESNKTDSSTDLKDHVSSMSNVSSDASNLERINRWKSAFEMFKEKPFFGWGPGTYAFEYAPFQKSADKTIISTNAGDGGNAHSEYLGPLSERGFFGLLITIILFITIFSTGLKVYKKLDDPKLKLIALAAFMGLTTYFVHGFLNNFLDQDKVAAPFWGFTAILVILDVYYLPNSKSSKGNL